MKRENKYIESKNNDNIISMFITNDNSVGLYNKEIGDIYHSKYGALTESFEKFVEPVLTEEFINSLCSSKNKEFNQKNQFNVLDICFGVGYNSKILLLEFVKNNIDAEVYIDAIDNDNTVLALSGIVKNKKIKLFNKKDEKTFNLISDFISIETFAYLAELDFQKCDLKFIKTFYKPYLAIKKFFTCFLPCNNLPSRFLHNIYYQYLSIRHKNALKSTNIKKLKINIHKTDARAFISDARKIYDLIYLDAFSPDKSPKLWTYEFFKRLYTISSDQVIICTYSKSQPVRNALHLNGFFVGNIVKNNKIIGTIASKNKKFIKNPLSEYDLKYLNTKSGICYHDENFLLTDEKIISNRNTAIKKSNLQGSSSFKKENKCTI